MMLCAELNPVPGRRMVWDVAPENRIAVTALWTVERHVLRLGMECGSFMMPKMTELWLAY
jgi:hypothetical protein